MSSITFDADFQTDKLESGLNKSSKSISAFVMESIIKVQKLEKEIDVLSQKLDIKATPKLLEEWKQKTAELGKETSTLTELQKEEAAQISQTNDSQKGTIASLIEWGKRLGIVSAAMTFFKAVIASSNALTEQFEFSVDGAKGALQQFFQVFSANTNQTGNVISNIVKGFKGAKELSQAVDLYKDSMKANQVVEAQEINVLKEKEAIFRNASNSATERKKALDEWITIRKAAAARELKIEQDLNEALRTEIKNRPNLTGITDQEIGNYATMYATNPQLMSKAEDMSKLLSGMASGDTEAKVTNLRKEIEKLLPAGLSYNSLMSSIRINSALNGKQIDALRESYKRLAGAEAGGAEVEAETARWMGSIVNKGAEADKKLNDIKLQIENLKTSLATANESERKGIADKIVLLEKELATREKIVRQAILASELGGFVPDKVTTSQLKIPTLFPPIKKPNLAPSNAEKNLKDVEKDQNKINDGVAKELERRKEILEAVSGLVMQLGEATGMSEQTLTGLSTSLSTFTSALSGDWLGTVSSVISNLISLIPDETKKFADQIAIINMLLKQQNRLIEESKRTGGTKEATEAYLKMLEDKEKATLQALEHAAGQGKPTDELLQSLLDIQDQIAITKQALEDLANGGITQNILTDTIAQAFEDGKTSVDDFADYMNRVLFDAVMNIFKEQILLPKVNAMLQPVLDEAFADGVLSPEDVAKIDAATQKVADWAKPYFDSIDKLDLRGDTLGQASTMTGTIMRNITEDTATEWVGLARKQSDDIRMSRDYLREGVIHLTRLAAIEKNTGDTVSELKKLNVKTDTIISNTKPVYSGPLG